ncbi:tRNA (adenosine(37)-N6)-threonylcarbamoyltransferase complex dimerization subunit type 1 TsaB [Arthrobacter sp. UM1]|uniref:tRNA (adenosine(37)-N6)-threonylcarbamoyltransferase complex dimerization subunit type 1 TsaB n=1 Tax=Arthrobacter sp. UM1 TaxID=2766776 RepID=UPI001CF70457|nr:tRNA (adenosine(37)-N6)-threonylcarbamoyltransferase complex dimerization subunit type 1 TsaB [Arthrobacter sp. UM1]MCB4208246.1 tRNA (adenosine(37)-N6)-threonylcarbamoyltransferase complex dimerization subunit type 1 TsaB [Arthrobacter sp. UM1]
MTETATPKSTEPVLLLAVDTSARASVALVRSDRPEEPVYAGESLDSTSHAEDAASMVRAALEAGGVPDAVAVGAGPGPFTGLRVGMATADALAFGWGVPCETVDSLDALAWAVRRERAGSAPAPVVVATDARRREVYWAAYDAEGRRVEGPRVDVPGVAAGAAASVVGERAVLAGEGAELYPEAFDEAFPNAERAAARRPHALGVAALVLEARARGAELPRLSPQYLRASDAKVPAPRKPLSPRTAAGERP